MKRTETVILIVVAIPLCLLLGHNYLLRLSDTARTAALETALAQNTETPATPFPAVKAASQPETVAVDAEMSNLDVGELAALEEMLDEGVWVAELLCETRENWAPETAAWVERWEQAPAAYVADAREKILAGEPLAGFTPFYRALPRDAYVAITGEDWDRAWRDAAALAHLPALEGSTSMYAHGAVRVTTKLWPIIEHLVAKGASSQAGMRAALHALENLDAGLDFSTIVTSQKADAAQQFVKWEQRSLGDWVDTAGLWHGGRSWLWSSPVCRPLFNRDVVSYMDLSDRIAAATEGDYYEHRAELDALLEEVHALTPLSHTSRSADLKIYRYMHFMYFRARARMASLFFALASMAGEGTPLPESLEVLPAEMAGDNVDPFTGKSFTYQLLGDQEFRLSSAGEDGIPGNEDDIILEWPMLSPCERADGMEVFLRSEYVSGIY